MGLALGAEPRDGRPNVDERRGERRRVSQPVLGRDGDVASVRELEGLAGEFALAADDKTAAVHEENGRLRAALGRLEDVEVALPVRRLLKAALPVNAEAVRLGGHGGDVVRGRKETTGPRGEQGDHPRSRLETSESPDGASTGDDVDWAQCGDSKAVISRATRHASS